MTRTILLQNNKKKLALQVLRTQSIRKMRIHPANILKKADLRKQFDTHFKVTTDEEGRVLVL